MMNKEYGGSNVSSADSSYVQMSDGKNATFGAMNSTTSTDNTATDKPFMSFVKGILSKINAAFVNATPLIFKRVNSATVSNGTIVSVDTTAAGTVIAAANAKRLSLTLQNTGTEPCLVLCGTTPSTTAYNFVLAADGASKQGNGGSVTIEDYTGEIKGITEANSTTIAVTEVGA